MKTPMLLALLSVAPPALFCGNALDAFKNLVLANKAKQSTSAGNSPSDTSSSAVNEGEKPATTEAADAANVASESEIPAGTEEQVKVPQFKQRGEGQAVALKQVDGSNNEGAASTPSRNLAAWYSEDLYDTPTQASWLQDDNYDPDAIADGFGALKKPNTATTPTPTQKTTPAAGGKVLTPVGGSSGGAMLGGGGGSGVGGAAHTDDALRLSMMQQGKAQRDAADTSDTEEHRRQIREEESQTRRAQRAARAARFRARAAARTNGEGS